MRFDAFWLPALDSSERSPTADGPGDAGSVLDFGEPSPHQLRLQIDALLANGPELRRRSSASIVKVIDRVARRLLDRGDPLRRTAEELLPPVSGFSPEMTRLILDRMAADWTEERLDRLLAAELGDPRSLDDFVRVEGRPGRSYAVGPRLATHIFSGNVPGVAVTSLIRTMLVKAPALGKTASGEPILAPLFARAIAEEDAFLGGCMAVAHWKGGDEGLEAIAFERAEVVIAYGSNATIDSVRRRVPAGVRLIEHGSRISFGIVMREALEGSAARESARDAAVAVSAFDQQGCVSPHVIFCETGSEGGPEAWVELLGREMEAVELQFPRGAISGAESGAIQQARGAAEIAALAGTGTRLLASAGSTRWTVIFEPDGALTLSCLNRLVRVVPVASVDEVVERVKGFEGLLQSVGVAGPADRVLPIGRALAQLGVSRIAGLREIAWPPPWWHHDGRSPLGELVRWCDLEERG